MYNPYMRLLGGFSPNDGSIDFYSRINTLLTSDKILVDLGAGRASWYEDDPASYRKKVRLMRGKVAKVIACDVDPAVLKNNSADECYIMDSNHIPVDDGIADIVVADYVLEHVEDPEAFAAEVNRILKPGGWFCARTPHKFDYVSIIARLVKNSEHSKLLKSVQPNRNEIDVFPTFYRMNTIADLKKQFSGYKSKSFVFKTDPSYYFGSKAIYMFFSFIHRILPSLFCGNLFVYLKKPG